LRRQRHNAPASPRLTTLQFRAHSGTFVLRWRRISASGESLRAPVSRAGRHGWRGKGDVVFATAAAPGPVGRRLRRPGAKQASPLSAQP